MPLAIFAENKIALFKCTPIELLVTGIIYFMTEKYKYGWTRQVRIVVRRLLDEKKQLCRSQCPKIVPV
jgi:hypothetical protein